MHISIIGLGLIGGSLALSLKRTGFAEAITGFDLNPHHASKALELGLVDAVVQKWQDALHSDIVVVAIPVNFSRELIPLILDQIPESSIITDVGSTKSGIARGVSGHDKRRQYVAAHPIAGTEYTGPEAAFDGLFENKRLIICDPEKSDPKALDTITKMFSSVGLEIVTMGSEEHDLHAAYVSHLSHIISFTLGLTVLDIEKDEEQIYNLASSGFASTARLAKSSADMWAPIFQQNSAILPKAIDQFIEYLKQFRDAIASDAPEKTRELMQKANDIRRILHEIGGVKE